MMNYLNINKKLLLSAFLLMLLPLQNAYAKLYCQAEDENHVIPMEKVIVSPATTVGEVVSKSGEISQFITCSNSKNPMALLAYKPIKLTNISINYSGRGECSVMESGYKGLGIAWYNYNYNTNRWQCNSVQGDPNNIDFNRRGLKNGKTQIIDQILLVKTDTVEPGNFYFNEKFQINEGESPSSSSKQHGFLYDIILRGDAVIEAPTCSLSAKDKKEINVKIKTEDVVKGTQIEQDIQLNMECDGYVENGTKVPVSLSGQYGIFPLDENYFSTSIKGFGMGIVVDDKAYKPNDIFYIQVNNRKGSAKLKYVPFIKKNSGIYPLSDQAEVTFKGKVENN